MLPIVSVFFFALAGFVAYFFLSGFIWGAGYYPTSKKEIDSVARLLELNENSHFYDLGSGYGRMIIAMSERYNAHSIGVEADPVKYWWTKQAIKRKRLGEKTQVLHSNFLNVDLSNADAIFVFLTKETNIMEKLYSKIQKECREGTKIVSYVHQFNGLTPAKQDGQLFLYLVHYSHA